MRGQSLKMGHPFFKYEILILRAFAVRSIREELTRMRQERIWNALLSAGNDQLFMADVMEIQQAFEHADHETASWTTIPRKMAADQPPLLLHGLSNAFKSFSRRNR